MMDSQTEYLLQLFTASQYFSQRTMQDRLIPSLINGASLVEAWEVCAEVQRQVDTAQAAAGGVWDGDRLDEAFKQLKRQNIMAIPWCESTISSAHGMAEELALKSNYPAYCFFHEQDLVTCIESGELWLAFDLTQASDDNEVTKAGELIVAELKRAGLNVIWNGSPQHRIQITPFLWLRHYSEQSEQEILSILERTGAVAA